MLLALKITLVPTLLLIVSLAARYFGPSIAGWLAGLPLVAGPILFLLALENGADFAAHAAAAATAGIFASICFSLTYAHACQRADWPAAVCIALVAWLVAATTVAQLPVNPWLGAAVAGISLCLAPSLFPRKTDARSRGATSVPELLSRMLAGAVLTLAVTSFAHKLGGSWSGLMAVFPVLGVILAAFSHRTSGAAFASMLLRGLATGLYAFAGFCIVLALTLPRVSLAWSFTLAISLCLLVQALTIRNLAR